MTKIDIISGFLGAGKTTFIKLLLDAALKTEKVVLIENEFGEIGIDGGFLKEAGIEIKEMNQGCICCSLVGDFEASLREVMNTYQPDRIIIEPSGVGKLSDIIGAVKDVTGKLEVELHAAVTVVDAKKARLYSKNFGEFFNNQIEYAGTVVLSRTDICDEDKIRQAVEIVRGINKDATVVTTPMAELTGEQLLEIISAEDNMAAEMLEEVMERVHAHAHHHHDEDEECGCGHHHHHHHDEDEECCCGHHHHDDDDEDEDEHEHHHRHHDDDEECCCGHHHHHHDDDDDDEHEHEHHHHHHDDEDEDEHEHEHHHHHHHDEDEECCCGHHHHHHHHDADEVFTSWGYETPHAFDREKLAEILDEMANSETYGMVVRAKGMLPTAEKGVWTYFDLVPEQVEIRDGSPDYTGKVVVIGSKLNESLLEAVFSGRQ